MARSEKWTIELSRVDTGLGESGGPWWGVYTRQLRSTLSGVQSIGFPAVLQTASGNLLERVARLF